MMDQGFLVFDTAIGPCGIVWGRKGVIGLQLPEKTRQETRARICQRFPDFSERVPPAFVRTAVDGIVALMRGKPSDLTTVPLDVEQVPAFHRRVYEVVRTIPMGSTLTYGQVAARLGSAGAARAVGHMTDDELIESLTRVRGCGRWTVEMILIFRLGRPDVLAISDYGIRKGFAITFAKRDLPTPSELAKHGARWAPYRSVASWYLWRAADTAPR